MSPDTAYPQAHSLPSSVSDTLEAMVGGGLDDLTLEDIDSGGLTDESAEVKLFDDSCFLTFWPFLYLGTFNIFNVLV